MTMKQTQTKLFDFSDAGLDFCAGSKILFPDRFKKMLSLGYNVQTVTSIAVAGNQITFTYGGAHGYVTNRVLKIDSGALSLINKGEFWLDSVTINTVTFTLDNAPSSVAGGFTTRIAPLGWSLEYENANVHVYKFKQLDESDIYLRLCFQNKNERRNCISPCVGKSFDPATGFITDFTALAENKDITTPDVGFKFEYQQAADATFNNYTYSQGFSTFGLACVVGSAYHFIVMSSSGNDTTHSQINAVLPVVTNLEALQYPILIGSRFANIASNGVRQLGFEEVWCGATRVYFQKRTEASPSAPQSYVDLRPQAAESYLPASIESFNTTTAEPISLYLTNGQFVGFAHGLHVIKFASTNAPTMSRTTSPSTTYDVDLNNLVKVHFMADGSSAAYGLFFAAPVEEIKIV